ncbi:hypothetical protein J6P68_03225 [bacterium]|nr:hypothetical protein [bacterium]
MQAILNVIESEIYDKYPDGFIINGTNYTLADIYSGIKVDLPSTITSAQNEAGNIPVTIYFNNIALLNTVNTTSFIVDGFSISEANQNIVNELNSLLQQDINVGMIHSNDASSSLFSDLTAAQAVLTDTSTTTLTNAILLAPVIGYTTSFSLQQAILGQI